MKQALFQINTGETVRLLHVPVADEDAALALFTTLKDRARQGIRRPGMGTQYVDVTLMGVFAYVQEATDANEALELL